MRKFINYFLIFSLILTSIGVAVAEPIASPDSNKMCIVSGDAVIIEPTEEDIVFMQSFEKIADGCVLNITVTDDSYMAFFTVANPLICSDWKWFLMNKEGLIVANVTYVLNDTDGYDVTASFLPNYNDGIYYLIWCEQ